ncbi:MAG: mechanosensitive ion channel family protein [Myxococcales bacterium]|nr:mechanosensitive ion channel family protein [Myxococcales bacterium]
MRSSILQVALHAAPEVDGGVTVVVAQERSLDVAQQAVVVAAHGLRGSMPDWLLLPSVSGLERWQWLGLLVVLVLAALVSMGLQRVTGAVLERVAARTSTTADDMLLARLRGPLRLFWFGVSGQLFLFALVLPDEPHTWAQRLFRVLLAVGFFWGVSRAIGVWALRYLASERAVANPGSRAVVNLFGRVGQLAVLAIAVLMGLSELGFAVTSVVAGLGIGGIALALGAQKTLENVFGAFALAVDQPFREGDFVKVEDFVGTVEGVGLRSTRIRTLDRTLISMPNGKLADQRLETFAARDRFRLSTTIGLTYGTTAAQVRAVRDGFERILRAHPKLWPDSVTVRFGGFGASSLDIEVMCWFLVKDFDEFRVVREEVLLDFMGEVEAQGSSFAFPTRTVHLVQEKPAVAPLPSPEDAGDAATSSPRQG